MQGVNPANGAKKVHLALCSLINCRTCLTNRHSILVLRSTIVRPPSAYMCLLVIFFSKLRVYCSKEMEMPIPPLFGT